MATDPSIGTSIRRARERRRWTQRRLADELGVNVKTVDNWENGRTSPRSSIGALESVLEISFAGGAEPEPGEWEKWERSVLTDDRLDAEVAEAIVRGARAAARAEQEAARGGSGRTVPGGRHRAAG